MLGHIFCFRYIICYCTRMSLVEAHSKIYPVSNKDIRVDWASYDFSADVSGIPDAVVRMSLTETGVMYVPTATPRIRVSHILSTDIQGFSALHEEICMNQKMTSCTDVEKTVIDSIRDPHLRAEFITTRMRMFGALCMMDNTNQQFASTLQMLTEINQA
jgi:hypothetical protein